MQKLNRIEAFNFIRAFCAIGIVLNHFTQVSKNSYFIFDKFANGTGSWGYSLVTVFFIISGALIYLNNENIENVCNFYVKRIKTIYPPFYISYIFVFIARMFLGGQVASGRNIGLFFLTILGVDGYFSSYVKNFYILGEWFLGALIIVYLLYPFLLGLFRKYDNAFLMSIVFLFIVFYDYKMLNQNSFRNIFSCILSFSIGIVIAKYELFKDKTLVIISSIMAILLYFSPVRVSFNLGCHISGLCWFFILFFIGEIVVKNRFLKNIVDFISNISYEIFLMQHVVIYAVVKQYNPKSFIGGIIAASIIMLLTFLFAMFIHYTSKKLLSLL